MNHRLSPSLSLYLLLTAAALHAVPRQPAVISDVRVVTHGDKISVEVNLSHSITPTLTFTKNPDRLIADFPNVSPRQVLQHIPVGKNGIERVRIGLNHSN